MESIADGQAQIINREKIAPAQVFQNTRSVHQGNPASIKSLIYLHQFMHWLKTQPKFTIMEGGSAGSSSQLSYCSTDGPG